MNRTVTFLLLSAALLVALGWYFDRKGPATSAVGNSEGSADVAVVGGPIFWPKQPSGPAEPATEGMIDLYLQVNSEDGAEVTPAANLELEVFFESDRMLMHLPFSSHASSLGTFQTEADGSAHFRLKLPISPQSKLPLEGALFVCAAMGGWQMPGRAWFQCSPEMDRTITQPLTLKRGATIQVRPIGYSAQGAEHGFLGPLLSIQALDFEAPEEMIPFFPAGPGGNGVPLANLSITRKGHYRLFARSPEGVGLVPSVLLDPAAPPQEITILFEKFGSIAGKVKLPPNYSTSFPVVLRAVVETEANATSLAFGSGFASQDYPSTTATGLVQEDGSFRVSGLAPGAYRLGIPDFGPAGCGFGWFSEASFRTGNSSVELDLPATFLELAYVRGEESSSKLKPGRVALTQFYPASSAYSSTMLNPKLVVGPNGKMGYYLLPGAAPKLLVYAKDLPVFEIQLPATFSAPILELEIPNPKPESGFLAWEGPSGNMKYEILSPEFGLVLDTWDASPGFRPGPMRRELPPGKYRIRGFGINRAEHATAEQWAQVVANETTHVEFDFPPGGWLEVTLTMDKVRNQRSLIPQLKYVAGVESPRLAYSNSGPPRLIMRSRNATSPIGLTFYSELEGMGMWHTVAIKAGETKLAGECFAPGVYDLDVRIPGYKTQSVEVKIEAGRQTQVTIPLLALD